MGFQMLPKQCHPTSIVMVPSFTSQHIRLFGVKWKYLFTNAYNGGEQSSKHAKADVTSAAANAHAR